MPIPFARLRRRLAWGCAVLALVGTFLWLSAMAQESAKNWRINLLRLKGPSSEIMPLERDKEALKIRLDSASRIFQIALTVTAALWALVVAKKGDFGLNRNHKPELVMFFSANWLLVLSLLAYPALQLDVAVAMSYSPSEQEKFAATTRKEIDPFLWDSDVWRYSGVATDTLIAATLVVACTMLSTRLLAETEPVVDEKAQPETTGEP